MRSLSLNKLEIVVLLHQYKKVTDVANALGVKQPTISFHMKSLEEEYGVPLFVNRAGRILFTEAGEALHYYATQINALAKEAKRVIEEFQNTARGSINLGASYVPGIYLLSDLLMNYSKLYPNISINLKVDTAPAIYKMVLDHSIDIGLISSQKLNATELLIEPIITDDLVLVLPPNHPFVTNKTLTPFEIANEPFIFHDPKSSTRQLMDAWANEHELSIQAKLELNSIEIIKQSVALGHGITFMSKLAIQKELSSGQLVSLSIPNLQTQRHIYCCYHKERWLTTAMKLLLDEIRSLNPH